MIKNLKYYLPDLSQSWILTISLTIGGSILAAVLNLLIHAYFPELAGVSQLLTYPVIFLPPAFIIFIELKHKAFENIPYININRPNFGNIGLPLSFALILPLVFTINLISEPLTYWMGVPDFLKEFLEQIRENKISSFISIVIFAPLMEEFFCRGIIMRGLLKHTTPAKAILWSALMFAVMHLNPWQAIPAFILGVLMGWIYWKTHSIWAAVFIHFINNGFSYLITLLFPKLPPESGFIDLIPREYYYFTYIISILFTVAVIYIMHKNYDKSISTEIQAHS